MRVSTITPMSARSRNPTNAGSSVSAPSLSAVFLTNLMLSSSSRASSALSTPDFLTHSKFRFVSSPLLEESPGNVN